MEGTMAEIRLFAGNFAPRDWKFCDGQLLAISQFQALFSLLGTTYGGDGRTTFGLPDLRGRAAIGAGRGPGLSDRLLGQRIGIETVTLNINDMPHHDHQASLTPPGYDGAIKPKAFTGKGARATDPTGNFLASNNNVEIYSSSDNVEMGESPVTITQNSPGGVTVNPTGGSQPHNNIQPSLALNYIICTSGLFPSRN